MTGSKERVLVVDDDVELTELLERYLTREGFDVDVVHEGERGVERALTGEYAIVVLDVMLPETSGLDVLRRVRAASRVPVVMLTARGEEIDRVVGLELGADDYLPKPFSSRELVARMRAVLRRVGEPAPGRSSESLAVDDVEINPAARTARRGDEPVELTTTEFDLLALFLRAAGRVVSREELVREVLGRAFSPFDRSIDNHVSNLRRKLGPRPDGLERIKSVRGAGYLYAVADARRGG